MTKNVNAFEKELERINPFDAKFREANDALRKGDYSQISMSLRRLGIFGDSASSSNVFGEVQAPLATRHLSLILPGSSAAPSTFTTPDIAALVREIMQDGSPSRSAPQTADVLKTVLEMRDGTTSGDSEKTSPCVEKLAAGLQRVEKEVIFQTPSVRPTLIRSSNNENNTEIKASDNPVVSNDVVSSSSENRSEQILAPPISASIAGDVFVSMKIGDKIFCVPITKQSYSRLYSQTTSPSLQTPIVSSSFPKIRTILEEFTKQETEQESQRKSGQDIVAKMSESENGADVESSVSPPTSFGGEKRKHTLERNKEAAWRYRKRKKEEKCVLEERVLVLENEKLELSTQVQVLKAELQRVNKILHDHYKVCKVHKSTASFLYPCAGDLKDEKMTKLPISKNDLIPTTASFFPNGLVYSPTVLQYLTVPASPPDQSLVEGNVFSQMVLPSGQMVVPTSPYLPYFLPVLKMNSER